jgi:enterochelin esterase-like enzyme
VSQGIIKWLLRGLAVVGLIGLVAWWAISQPLPASPPPTPTPTRTPLPPTATATATPTATPTPTPTPTNTPTPTLTPTPACTETSGYVAKDDYASQATNQEEAYRIYIPPCYDHPSQAERRYPVLYLLHGWPYDDAHWDNLGVDEAADIGIAAEVLPPFLIVMPKGREQPYVGTSGGERSFEGQVVDDLIPHVDQTYRTRADREGRAIGGISRGGVWALEIAFMHTELFSTVGAHSPALSVNMAPQAYDPFYLLNNPSVNMLRIYLDAGEDDWAREKTEALHQALEEQRIASEFVVHAGRHVNSLWESNVVAYLAFYTAGWASAP